MNQPLAMNINGLEIKPVVVARQTHPNHTPKPMVLVDGSLANMAVGQNRGRGSRRGQDMLTAIISNRAKRR